VEDEYLMALTIESLVQANGYEVVGLVSSVERGLERVRRGGIDAALLDINLRGQLVTPVAKALAESSIPYILVTAYEHSWFAEPVLRDAPCVGKSAMERELPRVMAEVFAEGCQA
jgi:two-component system, response regulator PdtaR